MEPSATTVIDRDRLVVDCCGEVQFTCELCNMGGNVFIIGPVTQLEHDRKHEPITDHQLLDVGHNQPVSGKLGEQGMGDTRTVFAAQCHEHVVNVPSMSRSVAMLPATRSRRYAHVVTSRVWTIPNALSVLRLLGVPLFLWLVLGPRSDGWAFIVLVIAGVTDWLDGYLARRLDQRSTLGALLDPLVDRLYIAATLLGLALRGFIPWWLVLVLVLREVMLVAIWPLIRRRGQVALPVLLVGKAGTFALLWGFPCLLLTGQPEPLGSIAFVLGWAFALWGVWLYWWAGFSYARAAVRGIR